MNKIEFTVVSWTHSFHRVINWHQGLKSFALQDICKLHVDRQHGPRVLHDPVLVHVWRIVVAGSAGRKGKDLKSCAASQASEAGGNSSNIGTAKKQLHHKFYVVFGISKVRYQQTSLQCLPSFIGSYITSLKVFNNFLSSLLSSETTSRSMLIFGIWQKIHNH